jgi:hypothetical protein
MVGLTSMWGRKVDKLRFLFPASCTERLAIAHAAITPPSTGRMLPVVQRDSSDTK